MALITIAIPIFNEEKFLCETIESALAQSFKDFQVIICDNCSTDSSYKIAKGYEFKDERVKVYRHVKTIDLSDNFEFALKMAETKYFVWLGGHDIFMSDYILSSIEHLEKNPKAVLVYPKDAVFVDLSNKTIREGACSNIESRNNDSAVKRLNVVLKNLANCTNIHGVFLTNIAKKLPFKKVIGPDNLLLAATALLGEIHSIPIQGIRRKEVRRETSEERRKRWEKSGVFHGKWGHLYLLTNLHLIIFVIKNKDLSIFEKTRYFFCFHGVFKWRSCLKQVAQLIIKKNKY